MRIRSLVTGVLTSLVLITSLQSAARADLLVSNLSQTLKDQSVIGNNGGGQVWAGQSFFTGIDNVHITSVVAMVGSGATAPLVVAQLRKSDNSGAVDATVGGLLGTFTAPDVSGGLSARTFLPDSTVNLSSSEKYWFILGSGNAGTYEWGYANGPLTTGPGVLSNYSDSADGGANWILRNDTDPYLVQINGSAVPEPSSWFLMGAGSIGLMCLVRRR